MAAREGADGHKELGELLERHRVSLDRAVKSVEEMERRTKAMQELLDSHRSEDEALRAEHDRP